MQVPSLRRLGWRFRPEWAPRDPGLLRMARLMAPATVGLAAVQVNIFISSRYASEQSGAVSWLDYAFRLLYLPIGLFGVALGTIATAGLARRAAEGDMDGLRNTLRQSLSMLAYLTVPATVGLMVLGVPVVRLLYERGRFTPADTQGTAAALFLYSFGLVGYTGVKVLAPAFYALGRPRVPLLASVSAVATNLVVIWAFHAPAGLPGHRDRDGARLARELGPPRGALRDARGGALRATGSSGRSRGWPWPPPRWEGWPGSRPRASSASSARAACGRSS